MRGRSCGGAVGDMKPRAGPEGLCHVTSMSCVHAFSCQHSRCIFLDPTLSLAPLPCHRAADIISALEFSHDGEHLATGDKGGRVVLFERSKDQDVCCPLLCLFVAIVRKD